MRSEKGTAIPVAQWIPLSFCGARAKARTPPTNVGSYAPAKCVFVRLLGQNDQPQEKHVPSIIWQLSCQLAPFGHIRRQGRYGALRFRISALLHYRGTELSCLVIQGTDQCFISGIGGVMFTLNFYRPFLSLCTPEKKKQETGIVVFMLDEQAWLNRMGRGRSTAQRAGGRVIGACWGVQHVNAGR